MLLFWVICFLSAKLVKRKLHYMNKYHNNYILQTSSFSYMPLLCSFLIIGIKHGFSCINVCQVLTNVARPEAEIFNSSRGTWQTLMYWETILNRCYCITSTKFFGKIYEKMWHYILLPFDNQRLIAPLYECPSKSINQFKMATIVRFNLDVSEKRPF